MSRGVGAGVVLITPEPLGERLAGPAIRALELGRALARDGRSGPVTVASLGGVDRDDAAVRLMAVADERTLRRLVDGAASVLVQGDVLGLHPWLVDEPVPVVVDAYDPFHLEQLEQARALGENRRRAVVRDCVRALDVQLARADLVLCASAGQAALWTGHLAALGRVNPVTYDWSPDLSRLLAVVPFGVSPEPAPARDRTALREAFPGIGDDDVVLLWGGGLYEWFDPETLVRAVARALPEEPRLRLVFLGTQHPVPGVRSAGQAARTAAEETGTLDRQVFFHEGWVPYDQRGRWLAGADVGVSTHHDHVETRFSFRTRLLDYLWCGLPVISTAGDDLADRIAAAGAGRTVPAGDVDGLTAALVAAAADPVWRQEAGRTSAELARDLAWDRVVRPLADFCAAPERAPDLLLDRGARLQMGMREGQSAGNLGGRVRVALRDGGPGLLVRRAVSRVTRFTGVQGRDRSGVRTPEVRNRK
jgi:glycosyltransferase involved in cell wall biosynthesis